MPANALVTPGKNNLQVAEGKSVVVSPDAAEFKAFYQQIRPQSIDQVREVLGLPKEARSAIVAVPKPAAARISVITVPVIAIDRLRATDLATRMQARMLAQQAASEYVANHDISHLMAWKPVIDEYLKLSKAVLNILALADIDVAKGATLTISKKTHALYANHVRIHGNGRIVCQGGLKFRLNSLQGTK